MDDLIHPHCVTLFGCVVVTRSMVAPIICHQIWGNGVKSELTVRKPHDVLKMFLPRG